MSRNKQQETNSKQQEAIASPQHTSKPNKGNSTHATRETQQTEPNTAQATLHRLLNSRKFNTAQATQHTFVARCECVSERERAKELERRLCTQPVPPPFRCCVCVAPLQQRPEPYPQIGGNATRPAWSERRASTIATSSCTTTSRRATTKRRRTIPSRCPTCRCTSMFGATSRSGKIPLQR